MNRVDLSDPSARVLPRILQRQALEAGDTVFLVRDDRRITFAEADRLTDHIAAGLERLGVGKGDRVVMYLTGRPETVLTALAANKLGAWWVPVNTDYKGDWLTDAIARSRGTVLVTESSLAARIGAIADRLGGERLVLLEDESSSTAGPNGSVLDGSVTFGDLLETPARRFDCSQQSYGDVCAVLWTSGTTGRSKAVLQSHNTWLRGIHRVAVPQLGLRDGDVVYNVLPLFNSGAWATSVFPALAEGVTCVLDEPFSVTHFWERIRRFGATHVFTLGAMHMFLWNAPARPDDADNPLRVAKMVPMPAEIAEPFAERFGIELLGPGYGQSECLLISSSVMGDAPPGSMGRPLDDIDVRLFDEDDREVTVGEVGEVRIRPLEPHVLFEGYFDDPEATREAFRGPGGEWYCTGDLARRDETGALYFVDRKKDAIRFAGRNISTMEVESVVRRHPAIVDVAAFGIPSEELASESELKIDVVLAAGATLEPEELASFINDNAPHYFVPRYIELVDSIPMTPTSKVLKYRLREKGVPLGTWDRKASGYVVRR